MLIDADQAPRTVDRSPDPEAVDLFRLIQRAGAVQIVDALDAHVHGGIAGVVAKLRELGVQTEEEYDRTPTAIESAKQELREQLENCYTLAAAALDALNRLADPEAGEHPISDIDLIAPRRLLEMLEVELGDQKYLNRVASREGGEA